MKSLVVLWGIIFSFQASASGDADRGAKLYQQLNCIQCHGDKGEGNIEFRAPRIGGQQAWYIEATLGDFGKNGVRGRAHTKKPIKMTAKDRADLAAYIGNLKKI